MKERIEQFKTERLGDRRRGFVETVETAPGAKKDLDAMDTST